MPVRRRPHRPGPRIHVVALSCDILRWAVDCAIYRTASGVSPKPSCCWVCGIGERAAFIGPQGPSQGQAGA